MGRAVISGADEQEATGACEGAEVGPQGALGAEEGEPNTPFPALQATGSRCQPPGPARTPAPTQASILQPQPHRALCRIWGWSPCTHRPPGQDSRPRSLPLGTVDIQGQIILCGGPSWALRGVEQHPWPPPPRFQEQPNHDNHRCPQTSPVSPVESLCSRREGLQECCKLAAFLKTKSLDATRKSPGSTLQTE